MKSILKKQPSCKLVGRMAVLLIFQMAVIISCSEKTNQAGEVKTAFVFGAVEKVDAQGNAQPLKAGQILKPSDSVRTMAGAFADLMFAEQSKLRLKENTTIKIAALQKDGHHASDISLLSGKLMASPGKLKKSESFIINTPTAVAGVRGTKFMIEVKNDKSTAVAVTEGKVWVKKNLPALDNQLVGRSEILKDIRANNEKGLTIEPSQSIVIEASEVKSENIAIENLIQSARSFIQKNSQTNTNSVTSSVIDSHLKELLQITNSKIIATNTVKELKLSVLEFISKSEVQELERLDNQATLETVKKSYDNNAEVADNSKLDTENTNYIIQQSQAKTEKQNDGNNIDWQRNFSKAALNNRPVIYGNLLIFGDKEGNLNAVNRYNGLLIWKVNLGSAISASPLLIDNKIYFGTMKGDFYAANAANGMKYWSVKTGTIVYGSSAAFAENKFFVGASSGNITAIDINGKQLWRTNIGSGIFSTPLVKNGIVFIGAEDNNLYALKSDKGEISWKFSTGKRIITSSAVVIGNHVFIGSYDKKMYALDIKDGKKIWDMVTDGLIGTTPVVQGDAVIFGTGSGSIYKVSAQKNLLWQIKLQAGISVHPQLDGNALAIAVENKVYLIGSQDGKIIKEWPVNDKVVTSPILSADKIYVTTQKGDIIALKRE